MRKCFVEVANEFANRNFGEVNANVSDVNTKRHNHGAIGFV
ncbi:hypothetical protein [Wolbachia endosymbiont of Litomosoides brasiliensis]|nr:hypothetical protein [Wolbachia endosymbiont of Litomosoides brasiliensis]